MSASMERLMRIVVDTKRSAMAAGKRGDPVAHLTDVYCTEFYPLDAEGRQRALLNTPNEVYQTFTDASTDIVKADVLVPETSTTLTADAEYPVVSVERWPWRPGEIYLRVLVEVLHR